MKNTVKRLLSLAIVLVMVIGLIPGNAFYATAAEGDVAAIGETTYKTLADAVAAAEDGATITFLANISQNVSIKKNLTINGAGFNYTGTITIDANRKNLTCENINFVKGAITRPNKYDYNCDLTVRGCNFDGQKAIGYAITMHGGTKLTVENCTAKNYKTGMVYVPSSVANISVKDVTVENVAAAFNISYSGDALFERVIVRNATYGIHFQIHSTRTYTVKNCTFDATNPLWFWNYPEETAKVTVLFEGVNDFGTKSIRVKSGALKLAEGATLIAADDMDVEATEGKVAVYNMGQYGDTTPKGIVHVGDNGYDSLAAAAAAAKEGETITLMEDITITQPVKITESVILKGNGKTLTYTGSDRAIDVPNNEQKDIDLLVKNLTLKCTASYCERGISYNENGKLTLNNVSIENENVTYALNLPGKSTGAEVVITNSDLTGRIALNVWGKNTKITATDSNFVSVDKTAAENYTAIALNNDTANSADNTELTVVGGSIIAYTEDGTTASTAIQNGAVGCTISVSDTTEVVGAIKNPVAVVTYGGDQNYSCYSLQNAIDVAVKTNGTVKLLTDVVLDETIKLDAPITIDLSKKKITTNAKKAFEVYADVTICNGAIEAAQRCVDTREAVELTLTDVTLTANKLTFGNPQPLTIGGSENGTKVNMENVDIFAPTGYGIITFVETELTAKDSAISGYNALYVKSGSEGSEFNFINTDLSGTTGSNDVAGNSFSVIAIRANDTTVNADADSSITATGTYCGAVSFGGSTESCTGSEVVIAGDISAERILYETSYVDNTLTVKAEYSDELEAEGFKAVKSATAGLVTVEIPQYVAQNTKTGVKYEDLNLALIEAAEGETVILLDNVDGGRQVSVYEEVVLDLNGFTLSVDYFNAYGDVIDSSEANSGVLTIKRNIMLQSDNAQMPLKTAKGYQFVEIEKFLTTMIGEIYYFRPEFEDYAATMLKADYLNCGIRICVQFAWNDPQGTRSQEFEYKQDLVQTLLSFYTTEGGYQRAFTAMMENSEQYPGLRIKSYVVSDTGVIVGSGYIDY